MYTKTNVTIKWLINRDLNQGCLVYMFSLRFSGSKFLINLRRKFRVRKIFSCTSSFSCTRFCEIYSLFILCFKLLFRKCVTYVAGHSVFNPIQDGHFRGCSRMGGVGEGLPSLKSVTHILQWWNLAQLYLT